MAEPKRKADKFEPQTNNRLIEGSLQRKAVAVDPPPEGAIGIQELLNRFEGFAETGELSNHTETGIIGVRELLARLANLAEAGYFAPAEPGNSEND